MTRKWFLASLLSVALAAEAMDFYEAPYNNSTWVLTATPAECTLTHPIPGFGQAVFRHRAGEFLEFTLRAEGSAMPITRASLSARSPAWMHAQDQYQNYPVSYDQISRYSVNRHLTVHGDTAEMMLEELGRGRWPTFIYQQSAGPREQYETRVAVSAVNFFEQYDGFHSCRRDLPPYGPQQISDNVIYFDDNGTGLSAEARGTLDAIIAYLTRIGTGSLTISSALSGNQMDQNWWAKRAAIITDYLQKGGLSSDRIRRSYTVPSRAAGIKIRLMGPEELKSYYYASNKRPELGPKSRAKLQKLVDYIKSHFTSGQIVINSYTDTRGSAAANMALSRQRGEFIRQMLIAQDIDPARISIHPYGESRSAEYYREQSVRSRRVDIELVS